MRNPQWKWRQRSGLQVAASKRVQCVASCVVFKPQSAAAATCSFERYVHSSLYTVVWLTLHTVVRLTLHTVVRLTLHTVVPLTLHTVVRLTLHSVVPLTLHTVVRLSLLSGAACSPTKAEINS